MTTRVRELPRFHWFLIFGVVLVIGSVVRALSELSNNMRLGEALATWQPFCWEFTSAALIAVLVPAIALTERRFPLFGRGWYWHVPLHLPATVAFSLVHVTGMVLLRKVVYAAMGMHYQFGPWVSGWVYEYRKDFATYVLILAVFSVAHFYLQRIRDRAVVDQPTASPALPVAGSSCRRLAVRKHNREFILSVDDIARIEADGNYVIVHANATTYRLRSSLGGLAGQLDGQRFVRIHRSQVVNIDHVREIQPWDHGDFRVVLADGSFINFSRRYRERLDAVLAAPAASVVTSPARH